MIGKVPAHHFITTAVASVFLFFFFALCSSAESVGPLTVLAAGDATISGPPAKLEQGALGHWNSLLTTASWEFTLAADCDATIELLAAAQQPYAGSEFEVHVANSVLKGTIPQTEGWHTYEAVSLGEVKLPKGKVQLSLKATKLPKGALGNIQAIRLRGARLEEVTPLPATDLDGQVKVYTTAQSDGSRLAQRNSLHFRKQSVSDDALILVDPLKQYQTIEGFGGAFTEAAASVFAKLSESRQKEFLNAYFDSKSGHGYRLCRTHINSCDFSLASYSYDEVEGDHDLKHFSIEHDQQLLIPFIKAAQGIAGSNSLKLLACPWSPPAWMKTNGNMLEGGQLKPECRDTWANYYCRYIQEYRKQGIDIWAISVQNEPQAVQRWESCIYSHEEERDFVRDHLGPALHRNDCENVKLVVWDHNRDLLFHRAKTIFDDPEAAKYVWGAGFHWYVTDDFANVGLVHNFYPDKKLLFTEGCLEQGAHIGDWSGGQRYAKSIINDLNNWAVGWIDWNLLLDTQGGPNHVQNYCSAPIIGDVEADELIYNSSYYYLGHFSRFIRPGAIRVECKNTGQDLLTTAFLNPDKTIAVVVLNTADKVIPYSLHVHGSEAKGESLPNSITTLCFDAALTRN